MDFKLIASEKKLRKEKQRIQAHKWLISGKEKYFYSSQLYFQLIIDKIIDKKNLMLEKLGSSYGKVQNYKKFFELFLLQTYTKILTTMNFMQKNHQRELFDTKKIINKVISILRDDQRTLI